MTTHTIDTTNSAGCSPCTPEAHQRAGLKTRDEMRSAIETFKAELGLNTRLDGLENWDDAALERLSGFLLSIRIKANRIYDSRARGEDA